jgi:AcrR family transcriptional regulator
MNKLGYNNKNRPVGLIYKEEMTTQKRSQSTRNHILDSALNCFSKNGYDATGVAEICNAAGVSKGAFYHHFPTKQSVFLALLNDWLGGIEGALSNVSNKAASVPEAFEDMAGMITQIFTVAQGKIPMFLEFWMQARRDPVIWQATVEPYRKYQQIIEKLIQKGIEEGTIKEVNSQDVARIIVSIAVGSLLQDALDPDATEWGRVLMQGIHLVLDSIGTIK